MHSGVPAGQRLLMEPPYPRLEANEGGIAALATGPRGVDRRGWVGALGIYRTHSLRLIGNGGEEYRRVKP
jgi:hypothetical protein